MLGTLPLRLRPPGTLPQGQPWLDPQWGSSPGLYEAWIFDSAGRPRNLLNPALTDSAVSYPAGIPGFNVTPLGNAGFTNGTTSGPYFSIANRDGFCTAFATGNDYTERLGFIVYTGGSNQFAAITNGLTNIIPFTSGTSSSVLGASGVFGTGFTVQPVAGVFYDLTVVRIGGSPFNALWYVNGHYVATSGYSGQFSGASTTTFGFDQRFQNNWMPAAYFYHTRWMRALTPGEILANATPLAGLIFPSDINIEMFTAAAPATPSPFFVPNFDPWRGKRSDPSLRTLASDQLIGLIGQDVIYAGPGQVPGYANENPQRRRSPEPLSWWQNLLLSTLSIVTAPFAQFDWPVLRRLARRQQHEAPSPTQLIGQDAIYAGPGQVPAYDTNQPMAPRRSIELRTWLQNLLQSTLNLVVFPFALFDWPNPRGPRPDSRLQRTHTASTPQQLIGQDQIYAGPGQVPSYDLNQPLRPRRTIELWTWVQNLLQSTLTIVIFPFSLLDWPNPLRRKGDSNVLRTHTQDTQRQLIGQDVVYGAPGQVPDYDLTPPRAPRRSIELLTWLANLVTTTLATLSPFFSFDFFRRRETPPLRVRDDQSLNLNLIGQDQIYGAPGEVPTYDIRPPQRRKLTHQRGWIQSVAEFLTFVGVPFAQTDWPLPRRLVVRAFDWFDKLFDRTTPPPPVLDPTRRFTEVLRRIQYAVVAPRWRYTLIAQEFYGMPFFGALPAVDQNQKQTLTFDFGRFLPPGVTLTGAPSLTLVVANGPDTAPASRITAGPILGTAPQNVGGTGLASCAILVQVATCVPGTQYLASFFATRTDGDIASGSSTFWCNPLTGA